MTNDLLEWFGRYYYGVFYPNGGQLYRGEQAKIMRIAYNIPENVTKIVRVK